MSADGGSAFPGFQHTDGHGECRRNEQNEWEYFAPGMTLRDWFAGQAPAEEISDMVSIVPAELAKYLGITNYDGALHWRHVLAKARYEWADAMLAERAKLRVITEKGGK